MEVKRIPVGLRDDSTSVNANWTYISPSLDLPLETLCRSTNQWLKMNVRTRVKFYFIFHVLAIPTHSNLFRLTDHNKRNELCMFLFSIHKS